MRIRVGDTVVMISGNHSGTRGRVLSVDHKAGRVVVEGVNRVFKHVRKSQKNPQGGRLNMEMPVQVSNVALICPETDEPTRVGVRYLDDGTKERYAKKSGASLGQIAPPRALYAKKK